LASISPRAAGCRPPWRIPVKTAKVIKISADILYRQGYSILRHWKNAWKKKMMGKSEVLVFPADE
jgi:hypothetical protein